MVADIKVSFIVPVYNVEKYLAKCLDSLVNQSLREIEIICVDDASTDDSPNILSRYASGDNRIRILHSGEGNVNMGQSVARNVGLKATRGEYVYMVDADDWVELNAAKELYEFAVKDDLDILYFGFYPEYEDEELKKKFENKILNNRGGACIDEVISGQAMIKLQMENKALYGTIWSALFKTAFLHEQQLLFDEEIRMEDSLFSFQTMLCAKRTKCVPGFYYHYYRRCLSVTTVKFTEKQLADLFMMAVGELRAALSCNGVLPEYTEYIARWVNGELLGVKELWEENNEYINEKNLIYSEPWKNLVFEIFKRIVRREPLLRKFTDDEIQKLKETEHLIVYGAGYVAGLTLKYLNQIGVDRFKIAVSNIGIKEFFMGNKIYSIFELCKRNPNSIVLVAVMPDKQEEMVAILESLNVSNYFRMIL